jgi:MFS family permease
MLSVGAGQSILFAMLPPAAREIRISPFQVSTIFATSAAIWVFVSPMWGRQSDVWGRRPVILIGLLGFALSLFLLAVNIEIGLAGLLPAMIVYPLLIASRCVFALVGSGAGPASQAYVADRTSLSDRAAGVAFVTAGFGLGEAVGPAIGALLAPIGLLAPLYFSTAFVVVSALVIWFRLPEDGPPLADRSARPPRMSFLDRRILPFVIISAALQAVRATTTITLAFFLQDTLGLSAKQTVQYAGIGFMALAFSGLFAQLVVVQRFKPSAKTMVVAGVPLMFLSFVALCTYRGIYGNVVSLLALGIGLGLVRPGSAAAASVSVEPHEQGSVAGLINGVAVVGNIVGPMLGTALYEVTPIGPYLMNASLMGAVLVFTFTSTRVRAVRN